MSEGTSEKKHAEQAPEAVVQTKRSFSIIWVVPIIALLIGGWLTFKAMTEKGPVITITFETAEGLEAGKTKIKFKDVEVGKVTAINLNDDRSGVVVSVEMTPEAKPYLTDKTQFWVVRATVAAGKVSGLGTLLSGAYIGINPSSEGEKTKQFEGLEKPPVLTVGQPGQHYILESRSLDSLDVGSPVYYRGIKVGQVVEYNFNEDAESVLIKVFINAPYDEKVRQNTRFWNASGIDMTMDATGLKVDTQSVVSILLGGVAFDLREYDEPGEAAEKDYLFRLYPDRASSKKDDYEAKRYFVMYFDQSVRGLSPGAPVEVKGIQVGEVISIKLQFDQKKLDFQIPVLIVIEPERLDVLVTTSGEAVEGKEKDEVVEKESHQNYDLEVRTKQLIEKGFRAQLKQGSLLTGQLYIDLGFYPDAPPATLEKLNGYPVFPTVPAPLEQMVNRVDNILKKVEKIPFGKISQELQVAIAELAKTLKEVKGISGKVKEETIPKVNASLDQLQETLNGIESTLGPDSALNYNARQVTSELALAIRSIRSLLEYLERDPQALILGKEEDKK